MTHDEREHVTKDDLRDVRDELVRQIAAGFKGVHARQDRTNGRIDFLQDLTSRHDERIADVDERIASVESDLRDTVHAHRRATDPMPAVVATPPPAADLETKAVTRWDVVIVAATISGLIGVIKFLEWMGPVFRGKP